MENYFSRENILADLNEHERIWDLIIIGGGATGLGTAVDAASRGFKTLLLEQADFAKGTSSRATKLVHGGVRYLAQGNIALVREALHERGLLLKNAPHLVKNESFIIPNYRWWEGAFYTIGLTMYDLLAGSLSFGHTRHISKSQTLERLPNLKAQGLYGGVVYHDGQFDDSRLAVNLAQTALEEGATVLNYFRVNKFLKSSDGKISGVEAQDTESLQSYTLKGKVIVNATGVFVDEILKMDVAEHKPMVRPSQGVHLVLDRSFMDASDAVMIPKTEDGRVIFAVPWHEKLLVGTTDTPLDEHSLEPTALDEEVDFILRTAAQYFQRKPTRADVKSVYAGLRPLAAPKSGESKTKEISRGHKLIQASSGLLTITGGKWTTYRKMAEDTVDKAIEIGQLEPIPCITADLTLHGAKAEPDWRDPFYVYGADKTKVLKLIDELPEWRERIHPAYPYLKGEVIWSVRYEMARGVEDILARRTRALFLEARIAVEMAPEVARLIAAELGHDLSWQEQQIEAFRNVALHYILSPDTKTKKR